LEDANATKNGAIEVLLESSEKKDATIKRQNEMLDVAEKLAIKVSALKDQLGASQRSCTALQKEITASKSGGAQRNKALADRRSEANAKLKTSLAAATAKQNESNHKISGFKKLIMEKTATILSLKNKLDKSSVSGIFHKGKDHLNIWDQSVTMQRDDGSTFDSRALLYIHQSGRGGLITYDPIAQTSHLCASPPGGLRPGDDCIQVAKDWMFKVNELQDGEVKDEDLCATNYNGSSDEDMYATR
jgi:seryl-tRNA synthetase